METTSKTCLNWGLNNHFNFSKKFVVLFLFIILGKGLGPSQKSGLQKPCSNPLTDLLVADEFKLNETIDVHSSCSKLLVDGQSCCDRPWLDFIETTYKHSFVYYTQRWKYFYSVYHYYDTLENLVTSKLISMEVGYEKPIYPTITLNDWETKKNEFATQQSECFQSIFEYFVGLQCHICDPSPDTWLFFNSSSNTFNIEISSDTCQSLKASCEQFNSTLYLLSARVIDLILTIEKYDGQKWKYYAPNNESITDTFLDKIKVYDMVSNGSTYKSQLKDEIEFEYFIYNYQLHRTSEVDDECKPFDIPIFMQHANRSTHIIDLLGINPQLSDDIVIYYKVIEAIKRWAIDIEGNTYTVFGELPDLYDFDTTTLLENSTENTSKFSDNSDNSEKSLDNSEKSLDNSEKSPDNSDIPPNNSEFLEDSDFGAVLENPQKLLRSLNIMNSDFTIKITASSNQSFEPISAGQNSNIRIYVGELKFKSIITVINIIIFLIIFALF